MASSSGMKASSTRSMKTCSNEFCGRSMAVSRPGWKSGNREVDLCDQCFVAFCYNQFCSVYHKTLKGWKTCRSCQKEFHWGCFASSSSCDEINSEIKCQGCVSQHANLNHSEETNDDTTITLSPTANADTTITPTLRTIASSKRTKTRNCEPERQAIVEARVITELTNVNKKHPRHRTGCQCIICIQPPSGSKHSSTCPCRACDAKRFRVKNMTQKASQKPHTLRKRKVPEPAEPSKQQIRRVSHGSEENQDEIREPPPSAEPSNQQIFTVRSGSEENQNEKTEPSQAAEPSNLQAITVNCNSEENQIEESLTGSRSNNTIRPLFDLNLPPSDDDDFVDLTHQYTNGYGGHISD